MMNKRKMQSLKRNVINVIIGGERMKNFNTNIYILNSPFTAVSVYIKYP